MIGLDPDAIREVMIFFPYASEKTIAAIECGQEFVHYCDGNAGLSMIQNKEVWLRNTTWMNDLSEIRYGTALLIGAYNGDRGKDLREALNAEWPGFTEEFERIFSSWIDHWQQETYIACLTEKLPKEDKIGRLSMWRAYGKGSSPIAFVINGGPLLRPSDAVGAYSSPVAYLDQDDFNNEFSKMVANIIGNLDFLRGNGRDRVFNHLFAAFRYAIICTKHPSFYEEREWRVVYQPTFEPSERMVEDTKVISGAPQRIFKIPMRDYPDEGFFGATLPDLLVRIIIGPGPDAASLQREFVHFLQKESVPDPLQKVVISNVPLRT
ncbi:DUF2971 domain-containing protein [Mesorhizobium sp. L2C067A000]|uniref:DUF2971 domain-containing protein n=1 Tax=Mesorhizobium sp. L2C067A000 TaxID=1287106 RepID=UPI0003D04011|nr:DUF2971 domain-containing protein [Mesorhizobium sp. L2C067A000]ESZ29613.1 hypothetical protein X733_24890 [Mesorhizobium sp. L2C067A000]